ncbi:putative C6 transcription factor [Aulographum hederae CBS 113979]|uniref:Putative C6 transcription factor n=1 Tax=Aulographum hederae CBS 113979 TaxID=1176131 RepID=A0A6G1GLV0_9PEZI|nr:putative C6 transcription factor [Aulographum hederae CBS 113979]
MQEQKTQPSDPSGASTKPHKILACIQCQKRKVKCDRKLPCANCVKAGSECITASRTPYRRRRRFPERVLLERVRHYEQLLEKEKIKYEPLHSPAAYASPVTNARGYDSSDGGESGRRADDVYGTPSEAASTKAGREFKPKNLWHAMNQRTPDSDDESDDDGDSDASHDGVRGAVVKRAWDHLSDSKDHLLFGLRKTDEDVSTLHPTQAHIFKLWQTYLDNVNPLLKITHAPSLQGRVIDAASNVADINPSLEALMFSIYCVSVLSLEEAACQSMFASSKESLLKSYQYGCQQALLNCGFLRSSDRDCLTALFLYLVSIRESTDPMSLSSMLSIAVRIAQRMGIHTESGLAKCTVLEAEMRRRLWWSLILFDARICEMCDFKSTMLAPTWDCRAPLNANDFDMRAEMKTPPVVQGNTSEALFAVVRSELADFLRNSSFYLDFTCPALKPLARNIQHDDALEGGEIASLEKKFEETYFKFCDPENPLHFMTLWTARGFLAKNRLVEHYSNFSHPSIQQTDTHRDIAITHALSMLQSDTALMTSPLTKPFRWLLHLYFPFPGYIHTVQDLRRRPLSAHADRAWGVMSDNYQARFLFSRAVFQAWEAREVAVRGKGRAISLEGNVGVGASDDVAMAMPVGFGHDLLYDLDGGHSFAGSDFAGFSAMDLDIGQMDWMGMNWSTVPSRSWQ